MTRLLVCLLLLSSAAVCRAADIDKAKLAECQVHVVGQYMPEKHNNDFRVRVNVEGTGKPMVVVLCSYMETQWNVTIAKDADVRMILISGWFAQSAVNIPGSVPVKTIVGAQGGESDYFWAYSKFSAEGFRVQEKLKMLLGKDIDTFQGMYEGRDFVIDGVKNQSDPQLASSSSSSSEGSLTTLWNEKVTQIVGEQSDRNAVEKVIRKLFDLETKEKEQRLKQAEADLKKLKEKFAKRLSTSEDIIQSRIEAYLKDSPTTTESTDNLSTKTESADAMAARAWEMWNERNYVGARTLLEQVVKMEPKNDEGWSKLGWTVLAVGDEPSALKAFTESLKLNPNNLGALKGRGRVYLTLGKLDEAEKDLLQGTETVIATAGEANAVENRMTASWLGLVEVNIKQKDWPTAIKWAEAYLKHAPDDAIMKAMLNQAKESH